MDIPYIHPRMAWKGPVLEKRAEPGRQKLRVATVLQLGEMTNSKSTRVVSTPAPRRLGVDEMAMGEGKVDPCATHS
jgi:hypothetical protein